ncbi:MAG: hypothetical protein EA383_02630 [Spirochaetaceae bacterium]|nr:MAG: hypothetical protein EA383_02630 [Spirochaetaceae bacterium]
MALVQMSYFEDGRCCEGLHGFEILRLAPRKAQNDVYLEARDALGQEVMTAGEELISAYRTYL